MTLTELVFPNVLVIQIFRGIVVFAGLEILLSFYLRIIQVSDNKEKNLIKSKKYKFKHKPIYLSFSDLKFFVENATTPETLYVESKNGDFHILEIAFDITGTRGRFYNKHFVIDDDVIQDERVFLSKLSSSEIIFNDEIKIYETFDHNKPDFLFEVIESLKNKK